MGGGEEESIEKKEKETKIYIYIFLRKEEREWNKKFNIFYKNAATIRCYL